MVEQVVGIGSVAGRIVARAFHKKRLLVIAQHPRELTGDGATCIVNELFRERHRSRQVCPRNKCIVGQGGNRRPVRWRWFVGTEADRDIRSPGKHDVVPLRVLIRIVADRAAQSPEMAALRKHRQMLANVQPGGACGDRLELAADLFGSIRFHVEGVYLRQPAGQENEDHRLRPGPCATCFAQRP